ncbi:6-phosphofructokinase [Thermodesulforhabdus norvegica]|uniref:6-phosphofructokinase n=1 Tax=Thermodesulforhabdus norvegica TaxID=39841 RepID=A0A1I4QMT2_9BACT|nr:6-phosphofructokinase [Thermodesulforhabdus norvegica]SFM41422.1 6-phosphofructokinase [Thermodesulforhabdus norvegica]
MRIAVLTSGGDAPGMNAAVRAVVRRSLVKGFSVFGVWNGYQGMVDGEIRPLGWHDVGGIINKGGTFLGTARSEDFKRYEGRREAVKHLLEHGINALVVIGGDGSLTGAYVLANEWADHVRELGGDGDSVLHVVGLPGSIDNDLYGTDMSIGADTALNHIVRAMDDLSSTAASHQRTFVVETMGRHCGYLALMAGLAGGASWVLIPEEELDMRWHNKMIEAIAKAREAGRPHQMVVVAEGARHADGLPIQSKEVCDLISKRLNINTRLTVLGHVQRGGAPTAFDRILATRLGVAAVDFLAENPEARHCHMVGLRENRIVFTHLEEVVQKSKAVVEELEKGNYQKALELRGTSFRNALDLVKMLTRITPAKECVDDRSVLILTGGADAPGMNAAVSIAGRYLINHGIRVVAARNTFLGLLEDSIETLDWHQLVHWVNRPSSEIGTARVDLKDDDYGRIAEVFNRRNICGLIAIGGWGTYRKIYRMVQLRERFDEFNIPVVLIPASIDNNLPGTEFSIGADTALNVIIDAVDKIRNTAGANRRTFIVEVMGRRCGFLALMSAMASGAEKAYLPEKGISLEELISDVRMIRESFACGKKMLIFLRNESASVHYTTDFIRRIFEEEGKGMFGVRTAVLGHVQRGGVPTAFDRILASRFGARAGLIMQKNLSRNEAEAVVLGLKGKEVSAVPLEVAVSEMDWEEGRPREQWFMELCPIADSLALPSAECGL